MTAPRKRTVSIKCEHGVPRRYEVTGNPKGMSPALTPLGKQSCGLCEAYERGYRDGIAARPISYLMNTSGNSTTWMPDATSTAGRIGNQL